MFENQEVPETNLEEAFNTLVTLARNAKLTYKEHQAVEGAVRTVHKALNSGAPTASAEPPPAPNKTDFPDGSSLNKDSSSEASQKK